MTRPVMNNNDQRFQSRKPVNRCPPARQPRHRHHTHTQLHVKRRVRHHRRIMTTTAPRPPRPRRSARRAAPSGARRTGLGDDAARRATPLRDHLAGHVLPRAPSLDAPLLVLLLGPTGAGKSSLSTRSPGVREPGRRAPADDPRGGRPRRPGRPRRRSWRRHAARGARPAIALRIVEDADAPGASRSSTRRTSTRSSTPTASSTDRLVEAADLGIFVTTATRYADRVPWDVLARAARARPAAHRRRQPDAGRERRSGDESSTTSTRLLGSSDEVGLDDRG